VGHAVGFLLLAAASINSAGRQGGRDEHQQLGRWLLLE
jgi:hypothetical protein